MLFLSVYLIFVLTIDKIFDHFLLLSLLIKIKLNNNYNQFIYAKTTTLRCKNGNNTAVCDFSSKMSSKVKLQRSYREQQIVVTVMPDTKEGKKCFSVLQEVANELDYLLERISFEKLDFGETDALDKFYSSNVAVADVTDRAYQAKLFYHLGLRESFEMKQNIVTYLDEEQSPYQGGLRGGAVTALNVSCKCNP